MAEKWFFEYTVMLEFHGTNEQALALHDKLDEILMEAADIHCGEEGCCGPVPDGPHSIVLTTGSRTMTQEEFDASV